VLLTLGWKRAELLEEKAKEQSGTRTDLFQESEKGLFQPINTTAEAAKFAGIPVDTAAGKNNPRRISRQARGTGATSGRPSVSGLWIAAGRRVPAVFLISWSGYLDLPDPKTGS